MTNLSLKYFWARLTLTIPISMFVLTQQHYTIIWGLVFIMIVDTILGLWVSIKHKVFASYKLGRIASKISKYFMAMASVWILSSVEPVFFGWTFQSLGVFLILTEVFSNFEKLAILGLRLPTELLAKLNTDFKKYNFGNKKDKDEALQRILNKEQANK